MALLDLNKPPELLPDLNQAHPDDEDRTPPVHEADIEVAGGGDCRPFDLNTAAVDEQEEQVHQGNTLDDEHGGGQENFFPFDLSFEDATDNGILDQDVEDGMAADLEHEVHDYGVYAEEINVEFDVEELPNPVQTAAPDHVHVANRVNNLSNRKRQDIYEALLAISNCGKLRKNSTTTIAHRFGVNLRVVQRVWQRAQYCIQQGVAVDVSSKKPKSNGRKKVVVDLSVIATIPLLKRSTLRKLCEELQKKGLNVNKSTLHRWFKDGCFRRHTNSLKPFLRDNNKIDRLRWCISMLDPQSLPNEPMFIDMKNIIHIDEKWFNATSKMKKFYMAPGEEDPHRTVQNKNSIDKVMLLAGVTQPRFDEENNCTFTGKIGVWAFTRQEGAKRTSRNRPAGTPITKTMKVDRNTYRSFLVSKVLPAIRRCWPRANAGETIWIQQDNAPAHILVNDEQFATAVRQTGLDIRLMNQPANSPDMNVLDLGFFASLQSLASGNVCKNMDELIQNVEDEYEKYDPVVLNKVFLTLQNCMLKVLTIRGGNRYPIPHMNKDNLIAHGILPRRLSCDRGLYESVLEFLGQQ